MGSNRFLQLLAWQLIWPQAIAGTYSWQEPAGDCALAQEKNAERPATNTVDVHFPSQSVSGDPVDSQVSTNRKARKLLV